VRSLASTSRNTCQFVLHRPRQDCVQIGRKVDSSLPAMVVPLLDEEQSAASPSCCRRRSRSSDEEMAQHPHAAILLQPVVPRQSSGKIKIAVPPPAELPTTNEWKKLSTRAL
jgi:hypothetical protein